MDALRALAVTALLFGAHPFVEIAASDWELVTGTGATACAKDREVCEQAIAAVRRGWWRPEWRGATLSCEPAPGCFSPRSECIENFNCGASR